LSVFGGLSVVWSNVLFMEPIRDIEAATAVAGSVCAGLDAVRGTAFWKIPDDDLLSLAETLERVGRLVYAAQVHLTGELDTRRVFQGHGAVSTAGLLRQRLCISPGEATGRVRAARAILPRDLPTGGETPPALPELRDAVDTGTVGTEQVRTVIATMAGLPAKLDPELRDLVRASLVDHAKVTEPVLFAKFARQAAQACDPDGSLDERDPVDKVELTLGSRNTSTGLTAFKGFLDDLGVEIMSKAIDGLAAPRPAVDGTADPRPAKVRRGQALVEVLRRFLDVGFAPTQGGERPHVTVTMDLDALRGKLGAALLDHGRPITAAQARMLACDAMIIPAVLGSASQVLDMGTAVRLFPHTIRRAITLRDRGCTFPGCDRPASWCDAHHATPWSQGGPTSYENGVLLCPHHHRLVHQGDWEIRFAADGIPEYLPPRWIDPARTPRRNMMHHNPFHHRT